MPSSRITDEYERKGLDVVILQNDYFRVEVLAGKGGDITEIRDKRTDTNVLFEAPHRYETDEITFAAIVYNNEQAAINKPDAF